MTQNLLRGTPRGRPPLPPELWSMSLEFSLNQHAPASAAVDCIVVGAFADGALTPAAAAIDAASGGKLKALVERGDLDGKTGKTTLLHDLPGVAAPRVLVIGLGDAAKFGVPQYIKAVGDAARTLKTGAVKSALFTLAELSVKGRDTAWNIRTAVIAADHACYRYTATLGAKNKKRDEKGLTHFEIAGDDAAALAQGIAIAAGVQFTRELGNLPPNICNPAYLAQQAQEFAARSDKVECEVLDDAAMDALGMGSLLAVARGSANRPRLVVLKYNNGGDAKPYVLVGKGITFDTGGVNLKTQGGIEEMKYDMCGAASVLGTFVAAVGMQLPVNLVVIAAAVENAIDGNAYRPSDVITSMSGKTIDPVRRADLRAALRAGRIDRRGHPDWRNDGGAGQVRHRRDDQEGRRPRPRADRRRRDHLRPRLADAAVG
jgi:leucyl aminopeptidase